MPETTEGTPPTSATASAPSYSIQFPADPNALTIPHTSWFAWAMLDRVTGRGTGSANAATETNSIESMIKPWIVADHLRMLSDNHEEPTQDELNDLTLTIIDSNDDTAENFYEQDGADAVTERLIRICGLTDLVISSGIWWATEITPADALRYGVCLADGRAAGPEWTGWLLNTMKNIRGTVADQVSEEVEGGRWGIIDGLPAEVVPDVSFKNGWTVYEDGWHVNCLAIHPKWILAIEMRSDGDLAEAAAGCASIASSLIVPQTAAG